MLNFVNVNPADLVNAKRVKITDGSEKAAETFVSKIDLKLTEDVRNTLKTMILLNRNKGEKFQMTALKVTVKYFNENLDFDK